MALCCCVVFLEGCGAINLGRYRGIEKTPRGEQFYLAKEIFLTAGSSLIRKESFDHAVNDTVSLVFIPRNERNHYVAETIWYDPAELEYRKIRKTYDKLKEEKRGEDRKSAGSTRIHSIPTKELYDHKPGLWKVALYLEGNLVRTLTFSVM